MESAGALERSRSISINVHSNDQVPPDVIARMRRLFVKGRPVPKVGSLPRTAPIRKTIQEADIAFEKQRYSAGAFVNGTLNLNLSRPRKNNVMIRLKCYCVLDSKRASGLAKTEREEDRLAAVLRQKMGKGAEILKLMQGEQEVAYGPNNKICAFLPTGAVSVAFQFRLPRKIPSSVQLQLHKSKMRVVFFIEAEVEDVFVFREFTVSHGQLQYFEKQIVSAVEADFKELCCCGTESSRIEISLQDVLVKQKDTLAFDLIFRREGGQGYYVPNELGVELWMLLTMSEHVEDPVREEVNRVGPVQVVSLYVRLSEMEFEETYGKQSVSLKVPQGLPNSDVNQVYSVYYFLVLRPDEADEDVLLKWESAKQIPLHFQL